MKFYSSLFFAVVVFQVSGGLWAQEAPQPKASDVLARLSYHGLPTGIRDEVRDVCFSVSADGEYRIVRTLEAGVTERRQGQIPEPQFKKLKDALESKEFRALSPTHGGIIREDAEMFTAELPLPPRKNADGLFEDGAWRLEWLNADGENPFPNSVATVIDWLKTLDLKHGKRFDYAEFPNVCPTGGLRLIQPSMATNSRR